jgi:hypothetical protein
MPLVALLADLGLIPEMLGAIIGAVASCWTLLHAWRLLREVFSKSAA